MPKSKQLTGEAALHGHRVNTILKNTVIGVILKNRENRKVPKLQDILRKTIEKQKTDKAASRQQKRSKSLAELLTPDNDYLTDQ